MAHVLSTPELATLRTQRGWSKTRLIIPESHVVYTALLNGVPADNDMVAEITVDNEAGTLGDVLPDMMLYVGTSAGGYDLGMCRIRKTPITGTFYIGETSDIVWVDDAYLTVVDDYALWQKSLRIVSGEAYMDWDVDYSDQHEDFDPVPAMGSDAVAKLEGATVDVLLGTSADVPAWVFDSTITARLWSIAGAVSIDDNTAENPTATFNATGTYLAYCTFTAANGKTFRGVRHIVIWSDADPHLTNFQIRNGRMGYETGGCSFDVLLMSAFDVTNLRKRSKVILCSEDFAENVPITLPGQIEGRENIICIGWISDIDTSRQAEFGEVSFTVESGEFWMRKIRDYPSGLELKIGTAAAWTDMPSLTVDRAAWQFLHWRSTLTRIMDVTLTGSSKLATRFQTTRANLWERLIQIGEPTIYARPGVDNFGRFFLTIEPQMVPTGDRSFPVVMTLTDNDIEDEISWIRRDVNELSMLFFSGISVDDTGGASSYFSMSPGHSYGQHGEEESQDNYLVASQADSNELCGLYFGWKNNDPYDLSLDFIHSMRILGIWPRQYFYYAVSAGNDPRGIGFAKNFLVRDISFNQDIDTGFISFSAQLEGESQPGPSIDGDVPTMEDIDFSIPDLPSLPGLPALPALPVIPLPASQTSDIQPAKIIIASDNKGIFYTENADEDDNLDIVYYAMNNGLSSLEKLEFAQMVVTPSGAIYAMTGGSSAAGWDKIVRASGLGGTWETVFLATQHSSTAKITGLGVNPIANEQIAFVVGVNYVAFGGLDNAQIYVGSGTSYAAGGYVRLKFGKYQKAVVFWKNHWIVAGHRPTGIGGSSAETKYWHYAANGSLAGDPDGIAWGSGAGATVGDCHGLSGPYLILWGGNTTSDYTIIQDLLGTIMTNELSGPHVVDVQNMAVSPTGVKAIANDGSTPYKTTDSLASWQSLGGTIPVGSDVWENCRDDNRWLFGGGIVLRLTMDQGATYLDKFGNLTTIAALIDITLIRMVG